MATVTKTFAQCGEAVVFQYDYDNVTFFMLAVRCINNGDHSVFGQAKQVSNQRTYSQTFPVGTTQINIPTNTANRLELQVDAAGRLDGVEWDIRC